ncbi:tRNA (cytosine(32)/uridine(32)-2'-O)-methyltransferase TrmJ [Coxiella burnetii]|uniref:tRNA (cytosine(32)/uridine(32)-2'-O)-methyltransferase TrmJ n=1 Tax=Coxiella burnetii TaxID=777 RepID=UPI0000DAEBCD|nr:tRNA (cytosine(32)/uridine(32)-2'-O)-methyltransferase TrmJ [Coxiella burnetii]ABX78897.1 RNA methyltransferase, TrmH family, group 1 [Coxiella burnetii RSA 331]ACJ18259.1 rRNA methylase, SpoU family [Coxiella burnetii CbuG_Q212]ACJ20208.1 RRNA methylase, SpoU family [Coxiella burnetii CbuK_Q154]AML49402.1 RNA methyltransferase [Coxiella burnetii]AML55324.1 RNA methyltransferase [Coxiella burnetii]
MFQNVRIVLVNPSHPGNIGAAARAMKTMGFSRLYLVKPELFPHEQATARAAGADAVLASARVVDDLTAALEGCNLVFGTSARSRTLPWPLKTARECAEQSVQHQGNIAIVFGRERSGLTNEELAQCQYHVTIPTEAAFSSLNLAQAVQILTYEMRMAKLNAVDPRHQNTPIQQLATADQMEGFYVHLEKTLVDIKFIDPKQPKMLMKRLRRLFNRAQIDETELNILRGILASIHRRDDCC